MKKQIFLDVHSFFLLQFSFYILYKIRMFRLWLHISIQKMGKSG